MSGRDDYSERVIETAEVRSEFVLLDDGYVAYWPDAAGHLTEYDLRILADELSRRNAVWDAKVNESLDRINED